MQKFTDRKQKLIEQINSAKKRIEHLTTKRAQEIGMLAIQHGLEEADENFLKSQFSRMAEQWETSKSN